MSKPAGRSGRPGRATLPVAAEDLLSLVAGLVGGPAILIQGAAGLEPGPILAASGEARQLLGWPAVPPGDAAPETLAGLPAATEIRALVLAAGLAPAAPVEGLVTLDGVPRPARALAFRAGDQVIVGVSFPAPRHEPDPERQQRFAQLDSAGGVAARLSHNLRNPLASVVAGLSILELSVTLAPQDHQLVAMMQSDVGRVVERVRDLLDRVRLSPLQPGLVSLASLLDRLRSGTAALASEPPVSLRIPDDVGDPWLLLDLRAMEQALLDLVLNAVWAAGGEGRVEVSCEVRAPGWIAGRFPRFAGGVLTLRVDDSGPGIPEERRLEAVRPFATTRRGSAGLGLSLASRTAELHGGVLEISGSPLGGACLEVHLPLAPREAVDCALEGWPQALADCTVDEGPRHLLCWSTRAGHFARTGEVHAGCRGCWVYRSTALHAA